MRRIQLDTGIIEIPQDATTFGVENLKKIVVSVGNISKKIKKFKSDGKYSFIEKIKTGFIISDGLLDIAQDGKKIVQEIKDLSRNEIHELIMHIASVFTIDTAKAENFFNKIIIPTLNILQEISLLVDGIDDVF